MLDDSYLGIRLRSLGLAASVKATDRDREVKINKSIYELKAVIEDVRMQCIGYMRSAPDLYNSCILSSLLTNCGTWMRQLRSWITCKTPAGRAPGASFYPCTGTQGVHRPVRHVVDHMEGEDPLGHGD